MQIYNLTEFVLKFYSLLKSTGWNMSFNLVLFRCAWLKDELESADLHGDLEKNENWVCIMNACLCVQAHIGELASMMQSLGTVQALYPSKISHSISSNATCHHWVHFHIQPQVQTHSSILLPLHEPSYLACFHFTYIQWEESQATMVIIVVS